MFFINDSCNLLIQRYFTRLDTSANMQLIFRDVNQVLDKGENTNENKMKKEI